MLRLPKFPIKVVLKTGESFSVLFKPSGNPKTIRILAKSKAGTHTQEIPAPTGEVLSWGGIARLALAKIRGVSDANTQMPGQPASEGSGGDKKPEPSAGVLPKVRSGGGDGPAKKSPPVAQPDVVFVRAALPDKLYLTAQSEDPTKHYMARYEGMHKDKYVLQVYFPSLREWSRVEVEGDYKLRLHPNKEKQTMKPTKNGATAVAEQPVNAPQATSKKGLTVYEAWGKAFEMHGAKPNAPENIVKFMQEQFPGRKTKWAKWVNPVRARYNAGKLPGVSKPKEKLAVYSYEKHSPEPARAGKDRRAKKERRTPPLKSIRAKAA